MPLNRFKILSNNNIRKRKIESSNSNFVKPSNKYPCQKKLAQINVQLTNSKAKSKTKSNKETIDRSPVDT